MEFRINFEVEFDGMDKGSALFVVSDFDAAIQRICAGWNADGITGGVVMVVEDDDEAN